MKTAIEQLTAALVKARKELTIVQEAREAAQLVYIGALQCSNNEDKIREAELEFDKANMSLKYHQGKVVAYEAALFILYDAKGRIDNEDDNAQGNALSDGR